MTDQPTTTEVEPEAEPLTALLEHLKSTRGFDFTGYKRTSLERRIAKRMEAVEAAGYHDYVDFLEIHQEEYSQLFNTLLINVTAFFRDPPAWEYLAKDVVPQLLERKASDAPIRVWCAGCASGEEAYTISIVLAEAMGVEAFLRRVKIYATDIDEEALTTARNGSYTAKQVDGVPQALLERYFERTDQRFNFRKDLRRAIIFGRNDLVQDAPISRIDLLVCRNTLMYFNAETQAKVLGRFNFALDPEGFLFLGRSEMLITHTDLFTPVSLKPRVFTKVTRATLRDRLLQAANSHESDNGHIDLAIRESSFDAAPVAQIVTDADGALALANRRARDVFHLGADDIGRPLKDLGVSYRPVELRASIDQALSEHRPLTLGPVTWTAAGGEATELEVQITPLISAAALLGVSITYADVTLQRRLEEEVDHSKRELETAYEELQSTVEELETTNEELQSTNEELETMNEELRQRTLELNEINAFLETILTSLGVAVVVLDRNGQIDVWNAHAEELWGLRQEEVVGQHFLALDIGLPVEQLKQPIKRALEDDAFHGEVTLPATTRRGRQIECTVTCLPLTLHDGEVSGAILLMERNDGGAKAAD